MTDTIELETRPSPQFSVIWLHGLGADAHDFEPIVPELVRPDWPALRFVFPNAPVRPITVNGGMRMRGWYDIAGADIAARQDEVGVRQSIGIVNALIAREGERGIAPSKIFLAGFSQGGAIALACGLRQRTPLRGIIALSTYLPLHHLHEQEAAPESYAVPIFMGHGRFDPVVPEALGLMSRDWIAAKGNGMTWKSYPMPHSVCGDEVRDLTTWMDALL